MGNAGTPNGDAGLNKKVGQSAFALKAHQGEVS
jgi:hypothetical protein